MNIKKLNYSQSQTLAIGKKFESVKVVISAEAQITDEDVNLNESLHKLKDFVQTELNKAISGQKIKYGV